LQAFDLDGKVEDGESTPTNAKSALSPVTDNFLKRSNTFVNLVQKALSANATSPAHILARQDAEAADKAYRVAVRKLDRHRLGLEERIEDMLKTLQRGEAERLRALKTGDLLRNLHQRSN
jgi:exonuclease VII large subunit